MTCVEAKELLPGLLDAALPEGEVRGLEAHVDACPHCQAELSALKKSASLVKGVAEVEPPPFFAKKVMAQVRAAAAPKPGLLQRMFFPLHVKLPLEALAAVLVAVIAIQVYRSLGPESLRPSDMEPPRVAQRIPSREVAEKKAESRTGQEEGRDVAVLDTKSAAEIRPEAGELPPARTRPAKVAPQKTAPSREPVAKAEKKEFAPPPPAAKAGRPADESAAGALVVGKKKDAITGERLDSDLARSRAAGAAAGPVSVEAETQRERFVTATGKEAKKAETPREEAGYAGTPPPAPAPRAMAESPAPRKLEAAPAEPAPDSSAGIAREKSADGAADRPWFEQSKTAEGGKKAQADKVATRVVTVRTGDRARAGEKLLALLPSVGARITKKLVRSDRDSFILEVAARELQALVEKLKELGTVSPGSLDAGADETTVIVRVDMIIESP